MHLPNETGARRAPVGERRNAPSSPALDPRLALAVHRDGRAGGRLRLHAVLLALEAIHHVVVLGAAAARHRGALAHILRVHPAAGLVARDVGSDGRARDGADAGGDVVAAPATDLVAEDAADQPADDRAADLVAAVGHALPLDPAALLRTAVDGAHRDHIGL